MVGPLVRTICAANIAMLLAAAATAELPSAKKIQSSAAKDAISAYDKEKSDLDTIYRDVVRNLNNKFLSAMQANRKKLHDILDAARQEAAANDQLDQALLLRDAAQEVAAMVISIPGTEESAITPAESGQRIKTPATTGLANLTTQQLEQKLVGTWLASDGTIWQIEPDAKIKSNHSLALFQSCGFYVRTENDEIYLGLTRPSHGCGMLKLVDLNTLITVNTNPSLVLKRKQ